MVYCLNNSPEFLFKEGVKEEGADKKEIPLPTGEISSSFTPKLRGRRISGKKGKRLDESDQKIISFQKQYSQRKDVIPYSSPFPYRQSIPRLFLFLRHPFMRNPELIQTLLNQQLLNAGRATSRKENIRHADKEPELDVRSLTKAAAASKKSSSKVIRALTAPSSDAPEQPTQSLSLLTSSQSKIKEMAAASTEQKKQYFVSLILDSLLTKSNLRFMEKFIQPFLHVYPQLNYILFQSLLERLQDSNCPNKELLPSFAMRALKGTRFDQLLAYQPALEQIVKHDRTFDPFIASLRTNSDALKLLALIENHPKERRKATLIHPTLTSTSGLIELICQIYRQTASNQQKELLLQIASDLFDFSLDYPFSSEQAESLYDLAIKELTEAPADLPLKLKQACQQLLNRSHFALSVEYKPCLIFSEKTKPFQDLKKIVEKNAYKKSHLEKLALDFKRYIGQAFGQIRLLELKDEEWRKNPDKTPGYLFYIQCMQSITDLAIFHILSSPNAKKRATWCNFYIRVAKYSLKIGDLTSAMALLGAFNHNSILRLSLTWSEVSSSAVADKDKLESLFDATKNSTTLRTYMRKWLEKHKSKKPESCLIPFLGLSQKDLTFIEDGNPTYLADGHFNTEKLELQGTCYAFLHHCLQDVRNQAAGLWLHPYHYNLSSAFENLPTNKREDLEEAFYQLSLKRENSPPKNS
ncbi:RasGEF domain-containing protein [Candidatus Protochlamydia phocaeensis]|uniref:RasGEF domain-containing protein n=1 Tax=Candidatus Protochlamydia phocaeensis TaxID=1414722 RepID=UPI0008399739|nr:RasGEF domain-containing protein [Candidatus Protochlamydia phocaeensis]